MTDFLSKYTGAQIDLMVSSGSSVSDKLIDNSLISGSLASTVSFGKLEATRLSGDGGYLTNIGTSALNIPGTISSSLQTFSAITASGDISSSATLIANEVDVKGNITASGGMLVGSISGSNINTTLEIGHITASRKLIVLDEIELRDSSMKFGDTLVKLHNSNDDGIISVYQNDVEKIKLSGVDSTISSSGDLTINVISASGDIFTSGEISSSGTIIA